VAKAGWDNFSGMLFRRHGLIKVLTLILIIFGGFNLLRVQSTRDNLPEFYRRVLEFNEKLGLKFLDPQKMDVLAKSSRPFGKKARVNGDIGLESELKNWHLEIESPPNPRVASELSITFDEIKKLPRTEYINQFKCIEGWSEIIDFAGVKFSDFLNIYHLGTHSGLPVDINSRPDDLYKYVGLETPDGEYYVSIDMKSMLSPQTLLAYEMNGEPLTLEHGAPLRLAIPNKYGVKNLKRIGRITFADQKLPDYWGEEGYDWFIGL
jgi:DMSO/TMAO reductase YedYZ molybdopterin-dependent catalytic subunit